MCAIFAFLFAVASTATLGEPRAQDSPTSRPATTQPGSSPAAPTPRDAEVLKELIREAERQPLAVPKGSAESARPEGDRGTSKSKDDTALVDGQDIVERLGRFTKVLERVEFRVVLDGAKGRSATLELLPNSWLEQIEREVASGDSQAIVTGEVTRYHGRYFLLVRNYRRQVDRGNLSP
ncbi:MAG: hypothetical protein HZB38_04880 [Planctomycetes bacterium]|nr:hypothetical protein [Planctomycetota bacterium]